MDLTEEEQQILDTLAEEFMNYPFQYFSGMEVAQILQGKM